MFPELQTNKYWVKEIQRADQPFVYEGLSHPEVIRYYGVWYDTLEATGGQMDFYERVWKEQTGCFWKIVSKETGVAVGICGMNGYLPQHERAELGYWLLPAYWGRGVMLEVLPVVIAHLFAHWKLHRLEAVVEEGNVASSRLAEKLGFVFEGVLRDAEMKRGRRISLRMYSLLKGIKV